MWNDTQFQFLDNIFLFIDLFRPISTYFEKILCTFLQYFAQTFSLQTHTLDTIASLNGSSGKRIVTK